MTDTLIYVVNKKQVKNWDMINGDAFVYLFNRKQLIDLKQLMIVNSKF
jgi:hypothetical protein